MFGVRINDREFRVKLRNYTVGLREPMLRAAGEYMRGSIARTFAEQGSPAGSWAPLSPRTLASDRRRGGVRKIRPRSGSRGLQGVLLQASINAGRKILIVSGRLKNSITYTVQDNRLIIGSNLVYARIHQMGGQAGRGRKVRIPARPYLVFRPDDPQRIAVAMERVAEDQARKAGLK